MDDDIFLDFLKEALADFTPDEWYIDTTAAAPNFITGEGYVTLDELRDQLDFDGSDAELLQAAGGLIAAKILSEEE